MQKKKKGLNYGNEALIRSPPLVQTNSSHFLATLTPSFLGDRPAELRWKRQPNPIPARAPCFAPTTAPLVTLQLPAPTTAVGHAPHAISTRSVRIPFLPRYSRDPSPSPLV